METEVIVAAISGVEELIKNEPAIAASLQTLFNKGSDTPTLLAELAALKASISAQTYEGFVPGSDLPKA